MISKDDWHTNHHSDQWSIDHEWCMYANLFLLRMCVNDPLSLTKADLEPIMMEAKRMHAQLQDTVYACISGISDQNDEKKYYVSARIYANFPYTV